MAPRHSAQVVMTAINLLFGRVAKKDPITNGFEWCHSIHHHSCSLRILCAAFSRWWRAATVPIARGCEERRSYFSR